MRSTDPVRDARAGAALAPLTTLGIGGPARWLFDARSTEDVQRAHEWVTADGIPLFVLGGGSNLVVADDGFDGLVLRVAIGGCAWVQDATGTSAMAGAGEPWDDVVAESVRLGFTGLECLSGIPGTVGGTPIQNVGAYGQEVADTIDCVTAYDLRTRAPVTLSRDECGFAYRMSRFKGADAGRFVVCGVRFRLRAGAPTVTYPDLVERLGRGCTSSPGVSDVRDAVLAVRRGKGMVIDPDDSDTRSVGSFFMNPVVPARVREEVASACGAAPPSYAAGDGCLKLPAAWLIERAGFRRGDADGPVAISTKHTLALVNRGGATARDVLRFAARIKRSVLDRFGISLRPEPVFVGFDRDQDVQFLQD